MKKPLLMVGVITLFCAYTARGQSIGTQAFNVSGGTATVNNYTHEWSVGEMALVNTFSTTSLTVTQGVLQPLDFPLEIPSIRLEEHLQVYPNPSSVTVFLKYSLLNNGKLSYALHDIAGKKLQEHTIQARTASGTEAIDMRPYADGSYMLHVSYQDGQGHPETISFKIQKIS